MESLTRHRLHGTNLVAKITHQFAHIRREVIHLAAALAAQRLHGALIAARGAAQAEIDAIRIEGTQRTELLRNDQGGVVRQHDAASPEPQRRGAPGQVANQHRCGGAGNARHVVVLRQPVAMVTPALRMASQIQRVAKRLGRQTTFGNGHQIQHGIGDDRHGTLHWFTGRLSGEQCSTRYLNESSHHRGKDAARRPAVDLGLKSARSSPRLFVIQQAHC